jgi:hypothetical protein
VQLHCGGWTDDKHADCGKCQMHKYSILGDLKIFVQRGMHIPIFMNWVVFGWGIEVVHDQLCLIFGCEKYVLSSDGQIRAWLRGMEEKFESSMFLSS